MDETVRSIRTALVDAIAGEHRLRREAFHERRESERWGQRADMADVRQLADLAAQARARAERHQRTATLYERRSNELRMQGERLQAALAATQGHGRAPPVVAAPTLEGRFAALELERELEQIRATRRPEAAETTRLSDPTEGG